MSASEASALASVRRVRVGSMNGPKIEAVRAAVGAFAAGAEVEGVAVQSGVSEQPVGHAEIARGARQRAQAAFASGPCDLAVGYEDGLVRIDAGPGAPLLFNVGCAVVTDGTGEGVGFSAAFAYPPGCAERAARTREPIGGLFDALWRSRAREPASADAAASGEREGNIGKLSCGVLTRSEYARHAVICALLRFAHPDLYPGDDGRVADGGGGPDAACAAGPRGCA